jgi:hypothetical protein
MPILSANVAPVRYATFSFMPAPFPDKDLGQSNLIALLEANVSTLNTQWDSNVSSSNTTLYEIISANITSFSGSLTTISGLYLSNINANVTTVGNSANSAVLVEEGLLSTANVTVNNVIPIMKNRLTVDREALIYLLDPTDGAINAVGYAGYTRNEVN